MVKEQMLCVQRQFDVSHTTAFRTVEWCTHGESPCRAALHHGRSWSRLWKRRGKWHHHARDLRNGGQEVSIMSTLVDDKRDLGFKVHLARGGIHQNVKRQLADTVKHRILNLGATTLKRKAIGVHPHSVHIDEFDTFSAKLVVEVGRVHGHAQLAIPCKFSLRIEHVQGSSRGASRILARQRGVHPSLRPHVEPAVRPWVWLSLPTETVKLCS
mmetsp:Transcript_53536/g.143205  ORF Transcript_53536/g.143205 Transcript_53536/m.143205 type:complete len:213 (-) Transcript_53536:195-833(-)